MHTHEELELNEEESQKELNTGSELEQLRNIIFGKAKSNIETELEQLQQEMRNNFEQAANTMQQQIMQMQNELKTNIEKLDERITSIDVHHDKKVTDLNSYLDKLASELEMNEANSKQQDEELHKRLDDEIEQLSHKFTKQHSQTIELLNQVKHDLNTTKTDRKTLAKLLAAVASNLDTEQDDQ